MRIFRPLYILLLIAILIPVTGALWVWQYIGNLTEPILLPLNEEYKNLSAVPEQHLGIRFTDISFNGWDGTPVTAVIAEKDDEDSSRQRSVLSGLNNRQTDKLKHIDYALVCVDWDHGIRSALPLAEYLTAAGIRCILWEPRGKDSARSFCTHGLKECEDVPLLIDELVKRCGKERPIIIAVGQGYGAGMLLQAAAKDDRLRGIVSIDALASLRESISRTMPEGILSQVKLALMDVYINRSVGFECFDVVPVDSATNLNRDTPALIINLQQDNPIRTINDALTIYRQLPSDTKEVWALPTEADAPGATTRIQHCTVGQGENERTYDIELHLKPDENSVYTAIIYWLHDIFLTSIDKPHVSTPNRPILTPDTQL